jgi:hypothetical protein
MWNDDSNVIGASKASVGGFGWTVNSDLRFDVNRT